MSFADEMINDLDDVFLQEFAEEHTVEGKRIVCIVDTDKSQVKSGGAEYDLAQVDLVLMAKAADLPARKGANALLNFDGRDLIVVSWDVQDGWSTVGLSIPELA